ncbi:MAG: hypothetical protein R3Y21_01030 [Mycoplasmatota bacterium]
MDEYNNIIETIVSIFAYKNNKIEVLLINKKNDPYKGYWVLPNNLVSAKETIENNALEIIYQLTNIKDIDLYQNKVYSDISRDRDARVIGMSLTGFIKEETLHKMINIKNLEIKWFDINEIPKLGYDHSIIIAENIEQLKTKANNINTLKNIFPSLFTLPELLNFYEILFNKKIDRRNFSKKMKKLNLVVEIGEKSINKIGRPANLYEFNKDLKENSIF